MVSFADLDLRQAARLVASSMRVLLGLRDYANAAIRLAGFPDVMSRLGYPAVAATVQGGVAAAQERLGITLPYNPGAFGVDDPTAALVEALGQSGYESAFDRGWRMSLAEVADYIEEAGERLPG